MATATKTRDAAVQQILERGTRTLKKVLTRAGDGRLGPLRTTTNEVAYLMAAVRLAIEALGIPGDVTEKRLQDARLRGLARMAELRKAAEPLLETGEVCSLLGVSRETIRKKVDRRQLLALPKGGDRVFPAFQFKNGEVLAGMAEVLALLDTDSPFAALSFLLSTSPSFDEKSAVQLLQSGDLEPVLAEARGFLKHGA